MDRISREYASLWKLLRHPDRLTANDAIQNTKNICILESKQEL